MNSNDELEIYQEITPSKSWLTVNLKELYNYKDLLVLFVKRDFVSVYKQTILGPVWFFVQPIFTTIIYTVIFGQLASISTDGLPKILFYMSGITCWNYFADCLNKTANTFTANASIFGKVYFPRLILPLSVVTSNLLKFSVQFLLFLAVLVYYMFTGSSVAPNIYALLFPFLIILMAGIGLGLGIIISSLTTKYRDLKFLVAFGVQLFMYATPIVYPLSLAKEKLGKWVWVMELNPMSPIIETIRYGFLGEGTVSFGGLGYSFGFMSVVLLLGIVIFNKVEQNFMDTV